MSKPKASAKPPIINKRLRFIALPSRQPGPTHHHCHYGFHLRECEVLSLAAPAYLIELATDENTLFALPPIRRTVPITITSITASITAYSAMSWPSSLRHKILAESVMFRLLSVSARNCQPLIGV